jgi:hypothetical protein
MPRYRIHRMKESPRENFRWAPHTGGLAIVKPKDYEPDREVEASTPYALWKSLLAEGRPLRPGDLLEISHVDGASGQLYITKYIGFEPASWHAPEPRPGVDATSTETAERAGTVSAV